MTLSSTISIVVRALVFASLAACTASVSTLQDDRSQWVRSPAEIMNTLDSLVSVSEGSYVHFVVGPCLGGRCEERISIYRTSAETPFNYRGGAWVGMPLKPQFYIVNRNIPDEDAGGILADARLAGIMSLITDTTERNNRSARYWLRARFGHRAVHIDNASLGSPTYLDTSANGVRSVYNRVEEALSSPLREQHRLRDD